MASILLLYFAFLFLELLLLETKSYFLSSLLLQLWFQQLVFQSVPKWSTMGLFGCWMSSFHFFSVPHALLNPLRLRDIATWKTPPTGIEDFFWSINIVAIVHFISVLLCSHAWSQRKWFPFHSTPERPSICLQKELAAFHSLAIDRNMTQTLFSGACCMLTKLWSGGSQRVYRWPLHVDTWCVHDEMRNEQSHAL